MKRALHVPPIEMTKAEAMPAEKRRKKRNYHRRWGGRAGDHSGLLYLKDMEESRRREKEDCW